MPLLRPVPEPLPRPPPWVPTAAAAAAPTTSLVTSPGLAVLLSPPREVALPRPASFVPGVTTTAPPPASPSRVLERRPEEALPRVPWSLVDAEPFTPPSLLPVPIPGPAFFRRPEDPLPTTQRGADGWTAPYIPGPISQHDGRPPWHVLFPPKPEPLPPGWQLGPAFTPAPYVPGPASAHPPLPLALFEHRLRAPPLRLPLYPTPLLSWLIYEQRLPSGDFLAAVGETGVDATMGASGLTMTLAADPLEEDLDG